MARPIAADHGEKRRAILAAAARLIADEGYGGASMSAIAAACGISKGNIYHYYPGKEALLFDILDTHLRALRDRVAAIRHESADPARQLRAIVTELLLAYEGADAEHAVQLNAMGALPQADQEALKSYQRDLLAQVRQRLEALAPAGVATDRGRMRALTMSVFALVNWHCQWDGRADAAARAAYGDLIARLVVGGLEALE